MGASPIPVRILAALAGAYEIMDANISGDEFKKLKIDQTAAYFKGSWRETLETERCQGEVKIASWHYSPARLAPHMKIR